MNTVDIPRPRLSLVPGDVVESWNDPEVEAHFRTSYIEGNPTTDVAVARCAQSRYAAKPVGGSCGLSSTKAWSSIA